MRAEYLFQTALTYCLNLTAHVVTKSTLIAKCNQSHSFIPKSGTGILPRIGMG